MAEEKMMRLSLAAKKLNVGIQTLVEKLGVQGQRVENNPNSKLNFNQLQILAKEYKTPSLLEDSPAVKPEESAPSRREDSDILFFRNDTKPTPEVAPQPVVAAPVEVIAEKTVPIEKIVPTPIVSEPIKEEPKVILAEPKSVVEAPKVKVEEAPAKIEIPVVKAAEVAKITEPVITETPKVIPIQEAKPEIKAEPEVIRAKAEPEGLRILGKIDLTPRPTQKTDQKKPFDKSRNDSRPNNSDRKPDGQRNEIALLGQAERRRQRREDEQPAPAAGLHVALPCVHHPQQEGEGKRGEGVLLEVPVELRAGVAQGREEQEAPPRDARADAPPAATRPAGRRRRRAR